MSTKETELKISILGSGVLRQKAKTVGKVNDTHRKVLSQMAQRMYDAGGIGLAAPQVGVSLSMIVVDIGSGLYKLINPKVVKRTGSQVNQEGCLSVPGICIKIKRARNVVIQALDENAAPITIEAQDLLACVLQHEIDHLRGKLIVDYASLIQKVRLSKKITELKDKSKDEELSESKTKLCQLQL
jgi:peptide deformylase